MFAKHIHYFRNQGVFLPVLFFSFGTGSVKIHNVYTCLLLTFLLFSLSLLCFIYIGKVIIKKKKRAPSFLSPGNKKDFGSRTQIYVKVNILFC